jgi:hypothetical protein
MLCEATVISMLERDREVLALGRRRRRASRQQRRALLRRDGGCARPGCPERRIERLHAHHMRHWLHGGRTDLANLVLLCDVDHGLAHDLDLTMSRRSGRLIVTAPDGRLVWGPADAAFTAGLDDRTTEVDPFVGVHPIDERLGRRPMVQEPRSTRAAADVDVVPDVTRLLFPGAVPQLPEAMDANGERMNLAYVVGVLMGNRDLERRLRAEAHGELAVAA